MKKAKNNQGQSHFSYKNDDVDLVEVGQFLRDTFKCKVVREWYVILDKWSGSYIGYSETIPNGFTHHKIKNPDLMIIKDKKIKLIVEIDGGVHDKKFLDTEKRNEEYFLAGLPFIVISKLEIETTIFDLVYKKVSEKIGN